MPNRNTTAAAASDAAIVALFERLALEAGKLVMDVYASEIVVGAKSDQSPVTAADHASERLILAGLRQELSGYSLRCRRGDRGRRHPVRARTAAFLLIDPLDGTREFVNRRPDFTVNIALIRNGVPERRRRLRAGARPDAFRPIPATPRRSR